MAKHSPTIGFAAWSTYLRTRSWKHAGTESSKFAAETERLSEIVWRRFQFEDGKMVEKYSENNSFFFLAQKTSFKMNTTICGQRKNLCCNVSSTLSEHFLQRGEDLIFILNKSASCARKP
ncbi:hypothetical protein KUTeg_024234 [Tegillarca granosa]|uniref:Uncharacterized protein n=1 Tax=Tegillarca granosa TaxID=220873 RepID=A0ABQ9E334_TEGGR|nr:hypothetical protein KUTeg_024234 [Tegillarca granosa]